MKKNVYEILAAVNEKIEEAQAHRNQFGYLKKFYISDVCDELSIFDWWNDYLSVSQLKQMRTFLEQAFDRGYTGYACFKVGAKHCANGMWAYKKESETGYSPDGECLYHSFVSGRNDWDAQLADGQWMHEKYPELYEERWGFTLKQIDAEIRK